MWLILISIKATKKFIKHMTHYKNKIWKVALAIFALFHPVCQKTWSQINAFSDNNLLSIKSRKIWSKNKFGKKIKVYVLNSIYMDKSCLKYLLTELDTKLIGSELLVQNSVFSYILQIVKDTSNKITSKFTISRYISYTSMECT